MITSGLLTMSKWQKKTIILLQKQKNMIQITEDYEIEYSKEFNEELTIFAVKIGDFIKNLPPLDRFYALKMVCDEIDGRATMYTIMGKMTEIGEIKSDSK